MGLIKGISQIMKDAQENMSSGEFFRVANVLSEAKDNVREKMQDVTSDKIRAIIKKLKTVGSITPEEIDCIRLWIVGDAESYTKMENNFNDWINEFNRLKDVLSNYENRELSEEDLTNLQGILEDAIRVAADIGNFLEKQERVKHFDEAVKDSNSLDTEILVKVLEDKLRSPEF